MIENPVTFHSRVNLKGGTLLLGFDGWMDGGDVSTGTIDWLIGATEARPCAQIDPRRFYIYNFPGSMEISALFRPSAQIEDGLIKSFEPPSNRFFAAPRHGLMLFLGKEPNFEWQRFADAILEVAEVAGIERILFLGSVGGAVPHSRRCRLFCSVNDPAILPMLTEAGARPTNYEGPAHFVTYLMTRARNHGLAMAALVAEVPAYVHGTNPLSIESMVRRVASILGFNSLDLDDLQQSSEHWEKRLTEALEEHPDLLEHIEKLESDYDNEVFDTQMGDLKDFLQQKGIRLD